MIIDQQNTQLRSALLKFHRLTGQTLQAVWRVYTDESLDKIILEFDNDSLIVEAEPADDTVKLQVYNGVVNKIFTAVDANHTQPWIDYLGEVFGWGWITINQQDAFDGILLSFGGITPQIMLNVMASSIKESKIHEYKVS